MIVGEAFIRIRPDDAGFSNEAEKGILSKVGGVASKAAGVFAAGFAVKQGADFLGGLIGDATESRRVLAETEQAIKATGGAAKVTAGQVSDMSESLARQTGIDDELIQTGANLLLTFKNIRNETGKGNDVFNQANQAVLDLSKQFGGVEGSAVQVGKALNDPIAGITALGRAGITFSDQQKDTIKALVETGDVLGAQKIILGEINAQVGGQAAAQATAADKLRVVWGNLREELGARLLPIVDRVATFLANRLPGALDATGRALGPTIALVSAFFKTLTTGFTEDEGTPVERFALMLRDTVFPIIVQVASFVRDNFQPILIGIGAAFLLAAGPVVAIGAALVLLYTRFESVRTVIGAVAEFLTGTVVPAIAAFVGFVSEQFSNLAAFVQENWAGIQETITHVINVVQGIIEAFIATVQAIWRVWGDELLNIVSTVWDQIQTVIETVVGIISGLIEAGLAIINGEWGRAWDAIVGIVETAWNFIKETVSNAFATLRETVEGGLSAVVAIVGEVPGRIVDALGDVGGLLYGAGKAIINGLKDGIIDAVQGVYDFVSGIAGKIADLKGPLDKDRRLLVPAGVAIMQGLQEGIASQMPALESMLANVTSAIIDTGADLSGAARKYWDFAMSEGDWANDWLTHVPEGERDALRARARAALAQKQNGPTTRLVPLAPRGTTSQPVNTLLPPVAASGPIIGQLIIHANGDGRAIATFVEDSIRRLIADGTVGRAMTKRRETFSTR